LISSILNFGTSAKILAERIAVAITVVSVLQFFIKDILKEKDKIKLVELEDVTVNTIQ